MYRAGMKDSTTNEILVSNYSYQAFLEFLRFIYADECNVPNSQIAAELISAAEFYGLSRLKSLMELLLSRAIDIENACLILEIAHRYNADQLKQLAFEFIIKNFDKVSKTNSFQEMNKECVTEILHVAVQKIKVP